MGLLYLMPIDEKELANVSIKNDQIEVRSYGLPLMFWGYLAASLVVIIMMFVGIKGPALKLANTEDTINKFLGLGILVFLGVLPITLTAFFFYQKRIVKKNNLLHIKHIVFGFPIYSKVYDIKELIVEHFIDSPNMARINKEEGHAGFENKGHFNLVALLSNDSKVIIDRNSQRREVRKLKELLDRF